MIVELSIVTRAQLAKLADRVEHATARLGRLKCKPKIIITYVRPSEDGPSPCERLVYETDTLTGAALIGKLTFEDGRWVPWVEAHDVDAASATRCTQSSRTDQHATWHVCPTNGRRARQ